MRTVTDIAAAMSDKRGQIMTKITQPSDVPKRYRQYIRYSKDFHDVLKQEREAKIASHRKMLEEANGRDASLLKELIETWVEELEELESQLETLYVDPELCNEAGVAIDFVAFHTDQIEVEEHNVEQAKELLPLCRNDSDKEQVQKLIKKHENFCRYHKREQRKALAERVEYMEKKLEEESNE